MTFPQRHARGAYKLRNTTYGVYKLRNTAAAATRSIPSDQEHYDSKRSNAKGTTGTI